ncbi:uncharacterized protein M421DRAFT_360263 [Didymella exigua CBS 183.55]|uniref:Uncharacterized protein n=1 Tax=Didymella exigua CBS 183.55 TaxID=1150837 RepID=A0A6A5RTQ6_9PLEO|nr:uncharacterized protein M421DRAFT_360263 [Didymella exigua CBS 183.55]KAF1930833.1 hypothetical protein M421DRAFT_360263 [Didymella exigua CBS 183.55]
MLPYLAQSGALSSHVSPSWDDGRRFQVMPAQEIPESQRQTLDLIRGRTKRWISIRTVEYRLIR